MNVQTYPISLPCACATLRRASRAVTNAYDSALRPLGLQTTQFTLLQALALAGEITQGELGKVLALDSTTLTRNLKLLRKNGWMLTKPGNDRREKLLRLSARGAKLLAEATPAWQLVQTRFEYELGDRAWHRLFVLANEITSISTQLNSTVHRRRYENHA